MKITCCIWSMLLAGARIWPLARASLYFFARARKPIAGLASNSLMKPAVVVQINSHTAGNMVTQTYR
ncbi:hypothetical protein D3C81_2051120 [compost metagenome]